MISHIIKCLIDANVSYNVNVKESDIDFKAIYNIDEYDNILKIISERNGKLLSDLKMKEKIHLQCVAEHRWYASPAKIRQGQWCKICMKRPFLTIDDCNNDAKKFGGKCLSNTYINASTPMLWECAEGHIWQTKSNHIRSGHWCKICAAIAVWKKRKLSP